MIKKFSAPTLVDAIQKIHDPSVAGNDRYCRRIHSSRQTAYYTATVSERVVIGELGSRLHHDASQRELEKYSRDDLREYKTIVIQKELIIRIASGVNAIEFDQNIICAHAVDAV